MKLVINKRYGGFGLSDKAYEKLIEWGVPVQKYVKQERGEDGLYKPQPLNDGKVLFDRTMDDAGLCMGITKEREIEMMGRYWEMWIEKDRSDPMLVKIVEELGKEANGKFAELVVVEIPDDVNYEIDEYDGVETVHEVHKTWG